MDAARSPVARPVMELWLTEEMPALNIPGFVRRPHGEAAIESSFSIKARIRPDAVGPVAPSDVVDIADGRDDVEALRSILEGIALL